MCKMGAMIPSCHFRRGGRHSNTSLPKGEPASLSQVTLESLQGGGARGANCRNGANEKPWGPGGHLILQNQRTLCCIHGHRPHLATEPRARERKFGAPLCLVQLVVFRSCSWGLRQAPGSFTGTPLKPLVGWSPLETLKGRMGSGAFSREKGAALITRQAASNLINILREKQTTSQLGRPLCSVQTNLLQ